MKKKVYADILPRLMELGASRTHMLKDPSVYIRSSLTNDCTPGKTFH